MNFNITSVSFFANNKLNYQFTNNKSSGVRISQPLEIDTVSFCGKRESLSAEEKMRRGILGRLSGPVASFRAPTRNGRKYTEELWEKVFENDLVKELFSRGGIPGELDHPDRDETCTEKIAIMMPEKPKKNKSGHLMGYFDILDTPCGRIAATLAKYGFQFGISSRGTGDTYTDYDGQESVDPDSYTLNAFDLVLIPACKEAVLNLVESFDKTSGKSLKESLNEALDNANDTEREIMKETLDNLDIDYNSETEEITEEVIETEPEDNIEEAEEVFAPAADDNGALIEELQEALKHQVELEQEIKSLQEKLSVCYTKEARYAKILETAQTNLTQANNKVASIEDDNKKLAEKLNNMRAVISEQNSTIKSLNESIKEKDNSYAKLNNTLTQSEKTNRQLSESFNAKDNDIKSLTESFEAEKTRLNERVENLKKQNAKLNESLQDAKKDSQIIKSEANAKITKCNQLTEKYKSIAKTAVDRYIECKAVSLGINSTEIKNRLKENYSFNDIEKVCEDLQRYKLNMRALPFDLNAKKQVKVKINESKKIIDPVISDPGVDDEIDETLSSFV